ncbi:MAG: hypothetical protein SGCHY_002051 [Lobulomycetales sp.]
MSSSNAAANSKTAQVQGEVDEVVGIMHENINKVMQRGEQLDTLQNKTDNLQNSSAQFKRGASRVRKQMWWKNMKLNMIIGAVVLTIIIVIVVSVTSSSKKK